MSKMNVQDAFQLLLERGIARNKQEVRKWLNEGYIEAEPPVNRRIGWKIDPEALAAFIRKFENGEFEHLRKRRRVNKFMQMMHESPSQQEQPQTSIPSAKPSPAAIYQLEEEVRTLRQQVQGLRRELNDLKKVLGFPILTPSDPAPGSMRKS